MMLARNKFHIYAASQIVCCRTWQPIKFVWTKTILGFGKLGENCLLDAVPLSDILEIDLMQESFGSTSLQNRGSDEGGDDGGEKTQALLKSSSIAIPRVLRNATSKLNWPNDRPKDARGSFVLSPANSNNLSISTEEGGYNSGRKYYIHVNTDEERREIVQLLTKKFKAAKKMKEAKGRLKRMKEKLHRITTSNPFQYFFAMLIMTVSQPL
jgi:hypothetical protein